MQSEGNNIYFLTFLMCIKCSFMFFHYASSHHCTLHQTFSTLLLILFVLLSIKRMCGAKLHKNMFKNLHIYLLYIFFQRYLYYGMLIRSCIAYVILLILVFIFSLTKRNTTVSKIRITLSNKYKILS